jgi:hypothetical protein
MDRVPVVTSGCSSGDGHQGGREADQPYERRADISGAEKEFQARIKAGWTSSSLDRCRPARPDGTAEFATGITTDFADEEHGEAGDGTFHAAGNDSPGLLEAVDNYTTRLPRQCRRYATWLAREPQTRPTGRDRGRRRPRTPFHPGSSAGSCSRCDCLRLGHDPDGRHPARHRDR